MKLFTFLLITLASFTMAAPTSNLCKMKEDSKGAGLKYPGQGLGPRFLSDEDPVTFNREYNEDGQPPAGRQVQVNAEHPANEPDDLAETLKKPSEDEHDEDGQRELYYNCYSYCWWDSYYGWITYCCPWWGCGYYYC